MTQLTIGIPRSGLSLISWPEYIAETSGFFADEDLQVKFAASSYDQLDRAVSSGQLPLVRRGPDADIALENGTKVVAGIVSTAVFDIVSQADITALEALRGARIGVIHPRYGSTLALRLLLRDAGLNNTEYELVYVGSSPARSAALRAGLVDATVLTLPYHEEPGFHVISRAGRLRRFVASSIQANLDVIETQDLRTAVTRYIAAIIRASRWLADEKHSASAVRQLAAVTGCSESMAYRSYRLMLDRGLAVDCEIATDGLRYMMDELVRSGDLNITAQEQEVVFDGYLDDARAIADTYSVRRD